MQTEVIDYKVEEPTKLKTLATKLGLTKQAELLEKPFPVIPMTPVELFVYRVLCPKVTQLDEYDAEVIPIDVMEALEAAKESGNFHSFEVWSIEEHRVDDPVLVGRTHKNSWETKFCIIGRWGNELLPFPVLLADVKKKVSDSLRAKQKDIVRRLEEWEDFIESDSESVNMDSYDIGYLMNPRDHKIPAVR